MGYSESQLMDLQKLYRKTRAGGLAETCMARRLQKFTTRNFALQKDIFVLHFCSSRSKTIGGRAEVSLVF